MRFSQPDGVGEGATDSALLGAWMGVPVLVEDVRSVAVQDATDGLTVTIGEDGITGEPTLTASGTSGAARISTLPLGDSMTETIRVIEFTADASGVELRLGIAPPLDGEKRGERGTRGYAKAWDRDFGRLAADVAAIKTAPLYARTVITTGAATGLGPHNDVTLTAGDPVLVAIGSAVGNGLKIAAAGAWERSSAMPVGTLARGTLVQIGEGTEGAGELWALTAPTTGTVTVGTTAVTWEAVSGGGEERPWAPTPTLTGAAVDPADLDLVAATYNMAVTHASVAGITLPGTGRSVTGVASGDTTATPVYQLDGDLVQVDDSDAELTIAAANGVRSAFGAMAAAGAEALVFGLNRGALRHSIAGQSNTIAEVLGPAKGYGPDTADLVAGITALDDQTLLWRLPVGIGAYTRGNADGTGTGTGPALGLKWARFARLLQAELAATLRFICVCRTGQGYPYFEKTSATLAYLGETGTQHATLNAFNLMISLWAAAGVDPQVHHIEWGEAHNGESKASFKAKRLQYIADIRAEWPLVDIIIHTPVTSAITGALDMVGVREADAEIAAELPYVYLYDAQPLANPLTTDVLSDMRETSQDPTGVHWSQQGFQANGDRFFLWYRDETIPTHTAMDAPATGALMHWAEKRSVSAPANHVIWPEHVSNVKSLTPLGGDADTPQHVPFLAGLNNRSATLFSSTTKAMGVGGVAITDNDLLTFIVVCYPSDVATANQHLVSAYNSTVSGARLGLQLVNPSGGMMSIHGVGGTDYTFGAGAAPLAVPQVLALQYGADIRLFRAGNGAIGQVGNTLTLAGTGGAQNFGIAVDVAVGATAVDFASANFRGHVAEALLFNAEFSQAEVNAKMASLARKYGISIAP